MKDWYNQLNSRVKWNSELSRSFQEKQGVRQGGVWSPTGYKIFINDLLNMFQSSGCGSFIGSIFCGVPTVADDVCLAASDPFQLQTMLNIQQNYACRERYLISDTKTNILTINAVNLEIQWTLSDVVIPTVKEITHLGIHRDSNSKLGTKFIADEKISMFRRTAYSLMGAGLYGLNGICPVVSIRLVNTYIVPRLLYGLEVVRLKRAEVVMCRQNDQIFRGRGKKHAHTGIEHTL